MISETFESSTVTRDRLCISDHISSNCIHIYCVDFCKYGEINTNVCYVTVNFPDQLTKVGHILCKCAGYAPPPPLSIAQIQ